MISYDVIGDYMSDLDDVRKRIEKRKRPLNDHNFKKLYNGMVRLMVMMIVVLGSLIVLKNPELEQKIFNQKYLQQLITFVSQSVLDFLPEDVKDSMAKQIPLGVFGEVSDIANTVVFLASDDARYITGQTIHVDGGMAM